ncbi:MAG: HNH endonuclease [Gemmataceae bacterium]|nr:HNH endonuclease [Gemmataceae bacterium]
MIFDYAEPREHRRHEPAGYADSESYRPWLRDEFDFRCVYCLKRETWGQVTFEFELDHFRPQSLDPQLKLDYLNLVYACRRCNAVKRDQTVADPFLLLRATRATTLADGSLRSHDGDTERLIRQLDRNSPRLSSWRVMWLRIVALAKDRDADLYRQLVGFPEDLPNLSKLRPPRNARKEGLEDCWFARRQRGALPAAY